MDINPHIVNLSRHLSGAVSIVHGLPESEQKVMLLAVLEMVQFDAMHIHVDFEMEHKTIAELNKRIYEPLINEQSGNGDYCVYIDCDAVQKGAYAPDEFEKLLRQACEADARTLAIFLHKYEKIGYLDFHGESKKSILKHLQQHFPTMRQYGYTQFAAHF